MCRVIIWGVVLVMFAAAQYVPSGVHLNRSNRKIEDIEWDKAKHAREAHSLQSFISRFPKSKHVKAAERLLSTLSDGERSRSAEDGPAYKLVPESKHVVRAVPVEQERK